MRSMTCPEPGRTSTARDPAGSNEETVTRVSRRRLVQTLALTGATNSIVEAAEPSVNVEALRSASEMSGSRLSDERLRVVAPVLKNRLARLQTLRDFEVDDAIAPRHGVRR